MTFAEKLRESRKKAGLSQEELAEKLNVSRQAITKWETEKGIPDISHLLTISNLFGIAVDDFISEEKTGAIAKSRLYESITEYDIDGKKDFDIKLGSAKSITVKGGCDEKIKVVISSDSFSEIQQSFKTKIDDGRNNIDIDVNKAKSVSETLAKEEIYIDVILPEKFIDRVEIDASCEKLFLSGIECSNMEFDGRAKFLDVDGISSVVEIDCNLDMDIEVHSLKGSLELNQVKATSILRVTKDFEFKAKTKGLGNSIIFEEYGTMKDDFSNPESENTIELNGMKSELKIIRE